MGNRKKIFGKPPKVGSVITLEECVDEYLNNNKDVSSYTHPSWHDGFSGFWKCDKCGHKFPYGLGILYYAEHYSECTGEYTEDAEFEVIEQKQLPYGKSL